MDIGLLLRLKGMCDSTADAPVKTSGQGVAESYPRIRSQIAEAVVASPTLAAEFQALFPEQLSSVGRPWGVQAEEAKTLLAQVSGWISGLIEEQLLERRIQAEAEAKARQTGFQPPH